MDDPYESRDGNLEGQTHINIPNVMLRGARRCNWARARRWACIWAGKKHNQDALIYSHLFLGFPRL